MIQTAKYFKAITSLDQLKCVIRLVRLSSFCFLPNVVAGPHLHYKQKEFFCHPHRLSSAEPHARRVVFREQKGCGLMLAAVFNGCVLSGGCRLASDVQRIAVKVDFFKVAAEIAYVAVGGKRPYAVAAEVHAYVAFARDGACKGRVFEVYFKA